MTSVSSFPPYLINLVLTFSVTEDLLILLQFLFQLFQYFIDNVLVHDFHHFFISLSVHL